MREIKSVWSGSMVSKIGLYCTMWKIKYVYVTFCIFLSELSLLSSLQWRIGTVHYAKRWLVLATDIKLIEDTASENIQSYIYGENPPCAWQRTWRSRCRRCWSWSRSELHKSFVWSSVFIILVVDTFRLFIEETQPQRTWSSSEARWSDRLM